MLDAFLTRAVEEFGNNARDRAETNRRIDAWVDAVEFRMRATRRLDQLRQEHGRKIENNS
jgi:hypothetical protein